MTGRNGASRESDERLLAWLTLRKRGWSFEEIAARYGVSSSAVRGTVWKINHELEISERT